VARPTGLLELVAARSAGFVPLEALEPAGALADQP
jgi:hypothetical protein